VGGKANIKTVSQEECVDGNTERLERERERGREEETETKAE
jgi:hypothetical protein